MTDPPPLPEVRLRTVIAAADLDAMKGKIVTPAEYSFLLTGPARVLKPNGQPLCVYLPGALTEHMDAEGVYDVLHELRKERTVNRGLASGTERARRGDQSRTRSLLVPSPLIGSVDPGGIYPFCRLTSWTGRHLEQWELLHPLLRAIDAKLHEHVPDRWAAQHVQAAKTNPEWLVPGTTFTTVTVNNTYSTGVHTDAGDLATGFSTLAVYRRGLYTGGELVFPRYRVAVDMHHGDLLLLDAHEWHGNTAIVPDTRAQVSPALEPERVSLVSYFREAMPGCGTADEELAKRLQGIIHTPAFRPYTSTDVLGCELGGAYKNVVGLAVGMAVGLGFGDNSTASVITRGLAETARLALKMGADPMTLMGLAGLGDLVATCSSPLSRNRTFGEKLGRGMTTDEIYASTRQVAEGAKSCASLRELAERTGVDAPVAQYVDDVVAGRMTAQEMMDAILARDTKAEME